MDGILTEFERTPTGCFGGSGPGCGTVFRSSVGLGPFVDARPTSGKVGAVVIILGNDLTAAIASLLTAQRLSLQWCRVPKIVTSVPSGATTGTVEVKTPKNTLKSNIVFRVTK